MQNRASPTEVTPRAARRGTEGSAALGARSVVKRCTPVVLRTVSPSIIEGDQLDSEADALPAVFDAVAPTDEETP